MTVFFCVPAQNPTVTCDTRGWSRRNRALTAPQCATPSKRDVLMGLYYGLVTRLARLATALT